MSIAVIAAVVLVIGCATGAGQAGGSGGAGEPRTAAARPAEPLVPGDHVRTIVVDGRERRYHVHVPPSYDGTRDFPVVLAFHGGATDALSMIAYSGLDATADRVDFIAVYPEGTGRREGRLTFNAGNCCGYAKRQSVDDVAFTAALLDDLATASRVDATRVYATGMSNGAMMSYRLASELSDRIAAIAPVGGPMGMRAANPTRAVPVIHFHGTEDRYAPFAGGRGKGLSLTSFYSVEHSLDVWIVANGCPSEPHVREVPDRADDGTQVVRKTWGPGRDGAEVVLIEIRGGGHSWPGGPSYGFLGPTTRDVSANELMWEFFARHPMPDENPESP